MSKALCAVTNPPSHQSLDAGWIYTSNLQVKGSGLSSQSLDLSLSPGSCAKMCLSLESVVPGLPTPPITHKWCGARVLGISHFLQEKGIRIWGVQKEQQRRVGQKQTLWLTRHRRSRREPASLPGPAPEPHGATGLRCPKGNGSALPRGAIWKPPWYCIGEKSKRIITGIRLFRLEL